MGGKSKLSQTWWLRPRFISGEEWELVTDYALRFDIDPYLIAAIGWHETHWGKLGAGREGYLLGVGVLDPKTKLKRFQGLENQLRWSASKISKYPLNPANYSHLLNFAMTVWRPGDPVSWAKSVYNIYLSLKRKYDRSYVPSSPTAKNYPESLLGR